MQSGNRDPDESIHLDLSRRLGSGRSHKSIRGHTACNICISSRSPLSISSFLLALAFRNDPKVWSTVCLVVTTYTSGWSTMPNLLLFGSTGFCGRVFLREAVISGHFDSVMVYVRDEESAKKKFSSIMAPDECKAIDFAVGTIEGESYSSAFSTAVRGADVIVNCISSYKSPHTQMSTLMKHILAAKPSHCRLVHFGYPRGLGPNGTRLEKVILGLVKTFSVFKYGPAIRDHQRVLNLLQDYEEKNTSNKTRRKDLEYTVFAAPKIVARGKKREYYGAPGTVDRAIQESRVWHSVCSIDAAKLILAHVMAEEPLPVMLCLSYAKTK